MIKITFAAVILVAIPVIANAQVTRGLDRRDALRQKYRFGDEADERQRLEAASKHKADFSTPEAAFETFRAAILRASKVDFLSCLTDALKQKKYPRGADEYIKFVEYLKYTYVTMYAEVYGSERDADKATVKVNYRIRRDDGTVWKQRILFRLERSNDRWRFAGLGEKGGKGEKGEQERPR